MGKRPSEAFLRDRTKIRRDRHYDRKPINKRKDPKEYDIPQLMPKPSCENCKSIFKEDREVTIHGYTRIDTACKQKTVCSQWTPYLEETEGSTDETV